MRQPNLQLYSRSALSFQALLPPDNHESLADVLRPVLIRGLTRPLPRISSAYMWLQKLEPRGASFCSTFCSEKPHLSMCTKLPRRSSLHA
ncbi:hypothetical protein PF003_g2758 [Phytophthora fragariae]|nr:hypothetical protein PF003_g2758 [Phytophthora fragariae]